MVDWPGRIAAVVFTPGCNLDCGFCHNRSLIGADACPILPFEDVRTFLRRRAGLLDGVVVSGGEPTLQPDLFDFMREARGLGHAVKLDTNGTRPGVLRALLAEKLLDYVAMDVKATPAKYDTVCGLPVNQSDINESIDLVMSQAPDYEFRTTLIPILTPEDIVAIGRRIPGSRRYVLQEYRITDARGRARRYGHDAEWLTGVLDSLEGLVERLELRGFEQVPAEAESAIVAA